jgi:TatD DNase family protein
MLIDTHAHLYAVEFEEDRDDMLARAIKEGVTKVFLPNVDSRSIEGMLALEAKYPSNCYALMGLHPCSVKENYKKELATVEKWLSKRSFKAVGEIGLDLYWDKTFFEAQKDAFRQQIRWAKALDIPIVIHARDALAEAIEIVESEKDENLNGIFHCFSGTLEEAQQIMDLSFYIGIGGVLTFKKAGLDVIAANVPLEYIVLETDAPYLAPTPKRGKRNESSYLKWIAEKLALVQATDLETVAKVTTENAMKVYKMKD